MLFSLSSKFKWILKFKNDLITIKQLCYGLCIPSFLPLLPKGTSSLSKLMSFLKVSRVVQLLRSHLPMHGTRVRALVQEDPTCCGATKPLCLNYWACALELANRNYWAHMPQLLKPARLEPVLSNKEKPLQWEAHTPQQRVAPACCS